MTNHEQEAGLRLEEHSPLVTGGPMHRGWKVTVAVVALVVVGMTAGVLGMQVQGAKADPPASSYLSVNEDEFRTVFSKMSGRRRKS